MLDYPSKSKHGNREVRERFAEASELISQNRKNEAVSLLEQNVTEGCLDSAILLGDLLTDGNELDRERSIELFRLASDNDDPSGSRNLAYCYSIGLNIEKNKTKAVELYVKSALLGNARSACNAGVMFGYGNGVEQDYKEAFYWFTVSAEGGYSRGMTNLGECYEEGKGTEKNMPLAIHWFEKSGSPRALYRLSEIYLGNNEYHNEEKGKELLRRSAEMGYSRSMVKYGKSIENDNPDKAAELFGKAAMKGNAEAVAALQERGLPIPERRQRHGAAAQ